MKSWFRYLVVCMMFCLCSCYNDDSEVSMASLESAHRASHMTDLIKSVTLHQSSFDDVIDGSSCFSLDFPYQLKVNSELTTINHKEDISVLSEQDLIEIQYPVSVLFFDYTTHQVNSTLELRNLQSQCEENFSIQPNSCLEFQYPVTIKDFNDFTSNFNTHHFSTNKEFFLYLEHLHDADMFEIEYPIALIDQSSAKIEISSNQELTTALASNEGCQ